MDKQKDFEKGWEEYKAKKKQEIENIAKILCGKPNNECCTIDGWMCTHKNYAEKLYNEGCRKIPKKAVVLTREEYGSLVTRPSLNTAIDVFEVRKETAEKFAERLKASPEIVALIGANAIPIYNSITNKIDEIAKEITEGKK